MVTSYEPLHTPQPASPALTGEAVALDPRVIAEVKRRGSLLAIKISVAWMVGGAASSLVLTVLGTPWAPAGSLVAACGLLALPVTAFLGWKLGPRVVRSGHGFWLMTIWTILLTDLELIATYVLAIATWAVFADHADGFVVGNLFDGLAVGIFLILVAYVLGLLIFGLPALLLVAPSAWYWNRVMQRTFNQQRANQKEPIDVLPMG